jgi:hypothetical protein
MMIRTRADAKGLRDMRTQSGKVSRLGIPYMAYMSISCLEMEKARREKEKLSAETRIKNLDKRIKEIEKEKDALLKGLGERKSDVGQEPANPRNEAPQAKGGFKLKY